MITRARLNGLAGTATALALAATLNPVPAYAAATPATLVEKAAALTTLEIEPEPALTGLKDCDLTVAIWQRLDGRPFRDEVRAAAVAAFGAPASLQGDATACTLFIRTEVFAAKKRDTDIEVRAKEQQRLERELKQQAALTIGLEATVELLGLDLKNFIDEIRKSDRAGENVKKAALAANDGTDADRLAFLGTGIVSAHEADRLKAIEDEAKEDEALRRKLIEDDARKRALAVLLVAPTEGMLAASDRDFITYIWENAKEGSEVRAAAERAVLSREPADWNAYIHTGIHEAREADRQLDLRKQYEADVAAVDAIIAQATAAGYLNLVHAARKALAGTAAELSKFVRVGQYDMNLSTGLESSDIPLSWSNSSVNVSNVNGCSLDETAATKEEAAFAKENLTALEQAQKAVDAASTPAERAIMQARLSRLQSKLGLTLPQAREQAKKADAAVSACNAKKPQLALATARAHTGSKALRLYGVDHSTSKSYAYFKAMNLSRVVVNPTTQLSYWVYPDPTDSASAVNSTCIAVDLIFSNGANLRDSGATDQKGSRAHPAHQCTKLTAGQWNQVVVPLGTLFNGRSVTRLDIAYDRPAGTGTFQGYIDDISITD